MCFLLGVERERAAESWRGETLWEESLPAVILRAVGVLGLELTFSLLLFSLEVEEGSGDAFLESSAAETLLEKYPTVWWAHKCPLGWIFTSSRTGTRDNIE